ncbi:MAG: transglycosylase domain-containing protein [Bacteroidales bacterium]|nr:transglycosylase domain-containing protein [Bacteroidales bacterium]
MRDKTKKTKRNQEGSKTVRNLWIVFGSLLLLIILFFTCVATGIFGTMPTFDELENPRTNLATEIISADGKILGTYYIENRSNVRYAELSHYMPEALISIEDERFTEHSGIDEKALLRVAFGVLTGRKKGGGSTITQQLAKNLFPRGENLSTPKLVLRKFQEWITATKLEHNYSKEEIVAMYLNTVAFGHNTFGIRSAASTFFDKNPKDLSIEECALMAGVVNAPTRYSPIRNPERSLGRRNLVLKKMAENGFITEAECDSISLIPIDMTHFNIKDHNSGQATYFREFLRGYLNDWAKNTTRADGTPYNIYRDGLRIYTTIDSRMQRYAEEAVSEFMGKELQPMFYKHWKGHKNAPFSNLTADQIDGLLETSMKRSDRYRVLKNEDMPYDSIKAVFNRPVRMTVFSWNGPIDTVMTPMDSIRYYKWFLQASLVSIESHTGHVKAYVGGLDYRFFKYDHVTQARRQVGSTFKPFLYSYAMGDSEFTPCTKIPNIPYNIELPDGRFWSPSNGGGGGGEISLKNALAQSNNWISAYLMNHYGPEAIITHVRRMGVESPIDPVPSICLGSCDLKLIEMVGAMSTFANQGVYIKPMFITRIEDKNGNVIQRFSPEESEAMSEIAAYKTIELMKGVVQSGTGVRLRSLYGFNNPIAGKTGTTQKNSDGYFMGITPDLTTGVWVGAEDRSVHFRSTRLGQGSHTALPIWALYMRKVYNDKSLNVSQGNFPRPYAPGVDLDFNCWQSENSDEFDEFIDEF